MGLPADLWEAVWLSGISNELSKMSRGSKVSQSGGLRLEQVDRGITWAQVL